MLKFIVFCTFCISGLFSEKSGWVFDPVGNGFVENATEIQIFLDLQCSDSEKAWPVLKHVAHHYGPQVIFCA